MDLDERLSILRKIKLAQLEPQLQRELIELAEELGYEQTVGGESNLAFVFRLYQAERAKEKRNRKALKKAERLIMAISSLHLQGTAREIRREEKEKRPFSGKFEMPQLAGVKAKEKLAEIGITDEKVVSKAVETFGEDGVADRVDIIEVCAIFDERTRVTAKKVFRIKSQLFLEPDEETFIRDVELLGDKVKIIDEWREANKREVPLRLDYDMKPEALLIDLEEIKELLELEINPVKKKTMDYGRIQMIKPEDLIKVFERLGFVKKFQDGSHVSMVHPDGRAKTIQLGDEFPGWLVEKKLKEAGISKEEFQVARKEAKV